jgi:hypothetical protein
MKKIVLIGITTLFLGSLGLQAITEQEAATGAAQFEKMMRQTCKDVKKISNAKAITSYFASKKGLNIGSFLQFAPSNDGKMKKLLIAAQRNLLLNMDSNQVAKLSLNQLNIILNKAYLHHKVFKALLHKMSKNQINGMMKELISLASKGKLSRKHKERILLIGSVDKNFKWRVVAAQPMHMVDVMKQK